MGKTVNMGDKFMMGGVVWVVTEVLSTGAFFVRQKRWNEDKTSTLMAKEDAGGLEWYEPKTYSYKCRECHCFLKK